MSSESSAPLRVVHIVETMELGGMERMIATLTAASQRRGLDVRVLCMKAVGVVGESLRARGVDVRCADISRGRPDYLASRRVARVLREWPADVAHTHNTPGLIFGALGARLAGVSTVIHTEHGRKFPDLTRYMIAERIASSWVQYVVGVSESTTHALQTYERIATRKLRTIPNGVDAPASLAPGAAAALRAALGLSPSTRLVGTAGRLVWEKGLSDLLAAWSRVASMTADTQLLIAGDGPLRAELEAQAETLGLRDRVRFLGARSDIADILQLLDVFVMSSVSEGLPMALLEAMSAGIPIVATDVGGMPAALDGRSAGLVVAPNAPEALATALFTLLDDAPHAATLGARARQRFQDHYTAASMASAYEQLYRREGHLVSPSNVQ